MPEMHLRKPGFTHSACGLFTNEETIQKFKETENSIYIYIYIKSSYKKLTFNILWLMKFLKIGPKEQLLIRNYVIKIYDEYKRGLDFNGLHIF